MTVRAGYHGIDGWEFNIYSTPYSVLPTMTDTKVAFTADSCMDHPEPARGTFIARCPAAAADLLDIEVGGLVRGFVTARDRAGNDAYLAYMEGVVDIVTMEPAPGRGPVPFNAVPTAYGVTSLPAGVLWSTRGPGGDPMGARGGVLVLDNTTDAEQTVTFTAAYAMSGPSTRGSIITDDQPLMFGLLERVPYGLQGSGAIMTYAGEEISPDYGVHAYGWSWTDPATAGPLTVTVKVGAGLRCEYLPVLAQDTGNAGRGHVVITVEASDYLAPLGRVRVGDEPWSETSAATRIMEQLGPLAERSGVRVDPWPYRDSDGYEAGAEDTMNVWVKKLDVDSRSALDVFRRTVAAAGRVAVALYGRVGISWALQPSRIVVPSTAGGTVTSDLTRASTIPSSALSEAPLRYSTDRMVNRIAVEHAAGDTFADARTITENAWSIARHGEASRTIETDAWAPSTYPLRDVARNLVERVNLALAAQASPSWELGEALRVTVDPDIVVGAAELLDNAQRFGRLVTITGPLPPRIAAEQRCRGQAFGFGGGRWHLELLLEPASYAGVEAARFRNTTDRADLTLYNLRAVTLRDMRDASV